MPSNVKDFTPQANFPAHNFNFAMKVKVMGTNLGYLLKSSQLYFNMMAGFTDFVEKLYGSLFFF